MKKEICDFLQFMSTIKGASPHTIRGYRLDLEAFEKSMGSPELSSIDKRSIRAHLAKMHDKQLARSTLLRHLASLRSFFAYLKKEGKIAENPMEEIERPKLEKNLPKALSYEEVQRLFEQPDCSTVLGLRDRCIMELLYSSALRISELVGLNRGDIDFANGCLRVRGKGKKERIVPFTQTARQWLERYTQDAERLERQEDELAVFLNRFGRRISMRSIDRHFVSYLVASGLSAEITPHTIRHTIATHWLEKGMDLKTIRLLLGHKALTTTTIYTQVSMSLRRAVYNRAHPLAREKVAKPLKS